jgi:hypothetical protein
MHFSAILAIMTRAKRATELSAPQRGLAALEKA